MMRFTFHMRQPFSKQLALAEAVQRGAGRHGVRVDVAHGFDTVRDGGLVLFGIGGMSREIHDAYRDAGRPIVFIDKGYSRMPYLRVAVNAFQPLAYLDRIPLTAKRAKAAGLHLHHLASRGHAVLFDGASNKFCRWKDLGDWTDWGQAMVREIAAYTDRPIIYRPRPSHNAAVPVDGAELSTGPLRDDLDRCALVVSYGGNLGFDAVMAGIPHFAIGDSIARPLSETDWRRLDTPHHPSDVDRWAWACRVAHCQYTTDEFADGTAWRHILEQL